MEALGCCCCRVPTSGCGWFLWDLPSLCWSISMTCTHTWIELTTTSGSCRLILSSS
ncbi:hypothetical protein M758_4G268400 [Ceratodon purpureus]|nr:hypothetical protein M758_4G268400 [Ceratodon purpureus]